MYKTLADYFQQWSLKLQQQVIYKHNVLKLSCTLNCYRDSTLVMLYIIYSHIAGLTLGPFIIE